MKTNLIGFAVAASLVISFAAFADGYEHRSESVGEVRGGGYQHGGYDQRGGQYVAQNVQKWVPGRYDQVYVPFCRTGRFGQVRCHGGTYESRWVPGYYTTVQEMVWVPSTHHHNPHARLGLHVGLR